MSNVTECTERVLCVLVRWNWSGQVHSR